MDLLEYRGKALFDTYSIPVTHGIVYPDETDPLPGTDTVAVKAQVKQGKRAAKGGIELVERDKAEATADAMLDRTVGGESIDQVLIEETVPIKEEYYVSLSIDRENKQYRLIVSAEGGSGVEEVSDVERSAITTASSYQFSQEQLQDIVDELELPRQTVTVIKNMYRLLRAEDATLVEINPLVETTDGRLVALDSKVRIDDNALYRHDYDTSDTSDQFVNLDGNIGIIGNGAGLVMATIDTIAAYGGKPADFLDIGGGADVEGMKNAMQTLMDKTHVDGIFVNIFGGITKCDEVAEGLIEFVETTDLSLPLVVRMVGTNQKEGRQLLNDNGIHALDTMDECAEQITAEVEAGD